MKTEQIDKCWVASSKHSPELAIPAVGGGPDAPAAACLATATPEYLADLIEATGKISRYEGLSMEILEFGGRVSILEIDARSGSFDGSYVFNIPSGILLTAHVFPTGEREDLGGVFTDGVWQPMLSEPDSDNLAGSIMRDIEALLKPCRERRVIGRLIGFTTRKVIAGFEPKPKPDFN